MLRHEPEKHGLQLDREGWASLDHLVAALQRSGPAWRGLTADDVREMVRDSTKQRFEISDGRIRALYGHSFAGGVDKERVEPPATLFHGTTASAAAVILEEGLHPMGRQYVHLSTGVPSAIEVGRRRTREVEILIVDARSAHEAGVPFYPGGDDVWLAELIPPPFIARRGHARVADEGAGP